jgi:hypothetical protein
MAAIRPSIEQRFIRPLLGTPNVDGILAAKKARGW